VEQEAKEHYTDLMLSYRHAFHAGSGADVLKHAALVFCLDYMTHKEKPLLCVDTHAGAGSYALHEGYAALNREWEQGLGKLCAAAAGADAGTQLPPLLQRYLELCFLGNPAAAVPAVYPGSPLLMARLIRPVDRLFCCELHPADYAACQSMFAALSKATPEFRAELRQTDGFAALKGLLPPPSRRGLILIDPPYEMKDDYERVLETIGTALRRFATGTYIVWYPLLKDSPYGGGEFPARLMELYRGNRCRAELCTVCRENSPRGMYGSGLIIFNPPWTLVPALTEALPLLVSLLGTGPDGWNCEYFTETGYSSKNS
jgi:23S rRNA (adenine2030-N6)-methyltransferase